MVLKHSKWCLCWFPSLPSLYLWPSFFFSAGGIPHAYTLLLYDFFKLILKHKLDHITVHEYACSGWTFHVKGLWYYLGNKQFPNLTLIGSPNFGHRSVYRDLEAQIAIVTKNQDLSEALHEEKSRLYRKAKCISKETFELTERKTPFWVYCVTRMIKNFLWHSSLII